MHGVDSGLDSMHGVVSSFTLILERGCIMLQKFNLQLQMFCRLSEAQLCYIALGPGKQSYDASFNLVTRV